MSTLAFVKRFSSLILLSALLFPGTNAFPKASLLAPLSASRTSLATPQTLESLNSIPLDALFPSKEILSWPEIIKRIREKLPSEQLSETDLSFWLNRLIVQRQIARVFIPQSHTPHPGAETPAEEKLEICFCRYDFEFSTQSRLPVFFPEKETGEYLHWNSPVQTGFMQETNGILGFALEKDLAQSPKLDHFVKTTTDSHRFRVRTINLLNALLNEMDLDQDQTQSWTPQEKSTHQTAHKAFVQLADSLIQELGNASEERQALIQRSFRVAHQMALLKAYPLTVLSAFTMELPGQEIIDTLGPHIQASLLKELLNARKKVQEMKNLPFNPAKKKGHALQNYFHAILQMSTNSFEHPALGIQLAYLVQQVETLRSLDPKDPDFKQKIDFARDVLLPQINSKGGLEELGLDLEEILFEKEFPATKQAVERILGEQMGIAYSSLQLYLEGPLLRKIQDSLRAALPSATQFKYRVRAKSISSLWKKLGPLLEDFQDAGEVEKGLKDSTSSLYFMDLKRQIQEILKPTGTRDQRIWDLFGVQIIFPIAPEIRVNQWGQESEHLLKFQNRIIDILENDPKLSHIPDSNARKLLEKKDFSEIKCFLQMLGMKGDPIIEVQVHSQVDSKINKHGKPAHWLYKLLSWRDAYGDKNDWIFDMDARIRNQHAFRNEYFHDELLLFNEMKPFVFPVTELPSDDGIIHTQYSRLSQGDRPVDLASTHSISQFTRDYKGAYRVTLDENGEKVYTPQDWDPIQSGQIYYFGDIEGTVRPSIFELDEHRKDTPTLKFFEKAILKYGRPATVATYLQIRNGQLDPTPNATESLGLRILKKDLEEELPGLKLSDEKKFADFVRTLGQALHFGEPEQLYRTLGIMENPEVLNPEQEVRIVARLIRDFYREHLTVPLPLEEELNRSHRQDESKDWVERAISDFKMPSDSSPREILLKMLLAREKGRQMFERTQTLAQMFWRREAVVEAMGYSSEDQLFRALGSAFVTPSMLYFRLMQLDQVYQLKMFIPQSRNTPDILNQITHFLKEQGAVSLSSRNDWVIPFDLNEKTDTLSLPVLLWRGIRQEELQELTSKLWLTVALPEKASVDWNSFTQQTWVHLSFNDNFSENGITQEDIQAALFQFFKDAGINIPAAHGGTFSLSFLGTPGIFEAGHFKDFLFAEMEKRLGLTKGDVEKIFSVDLARTEDEIQRAA